MIKLMKDPDLIVAELECPRGIETTYVIPVRGVILDEKIPKLILILEGVFAHDIVDLTLARKILKYLVVCVILFYKEVLFHSDIKPQIIVKCGSSWRACSIQ